MTKTPYNTTLVETHELFSPSLTVTSFTSYTVHKQSWYLQFILSINNHGISGRTWADNQQYTRTSKFPSCIDYQNQKATIKPNEVFIQCFEKGEVA